MCTRQSGMAIAEMLKITVLGHISEEKGVADFLYDIGAVEILEAKEENGVQGRRGRDTAISDLDRKISQLKYCIDFLDRFGKPKKNLIQQFSGGKVLVPQDRFIELASDANFIDEINEKCRSYDFRLSELTTQESQASTLLDSLRPWIQLDLPLSELRGTNKTGILLGVSPRESLEAAVNEAAEAGIAHLVEVVSEERKETRFVAFYARQDEEKFTEILKKNDITIIPSLGPSGTVRDEIGRLTEKLARNQREQEELRAEVTKLFVHREKLYSLYDFYSMEKEKMLARSRWYGTRESFALEGWVPRDRIDQLKRGLESKFESTCVLAREPEEGEDVPVLLANMPVIVPFEAVTEIYSLPGYRGIDPTPMLAPFFFIFFGLCLGDVGYGIALTAISLLLLKKVRMAGIAKKLFTLLAICGVSSAIAGALTGGWLGTLIKVPPLWFNPLDDPLKMLVVSFALGIVQIYVGLAIKFYMNVKQGSPWAAVFDQGFWMIFLAGLIFLLVGPSLEIAWLSRSAPVLAIAGALGLVATQGRHHKNPIARLGSGILSLYGVTGYLSDVLSYSRLLALGLASSVIAGVMDIMALMIARIPVLGWIVAFIILAGGHLFNLLINVVGSYVHSSRLQYVEFFGKFFEGGGRRFMPFARKTRYVELVGKGDA